MRRVHWSVWGLLGFFGMLAVGLWIDAHWLPGVGVVSPAAVVSPPLTITLVEREMEPTPPAAAPRDGSCGSACADQAIAPESLSLECPSRMDVDDSTLLDDLEYSDVSLRNAPELLPEPELVRAPSVEQPLDTSEFEHIGLEIPFVPAVSEAPPAREPVAAHEAATHKAATHGAGANDETESSPAPPSSPLLPAAIDDPDISAMMELWKRRIGGSSELTPSPREVAEAIRRRQELDRAAPPPDLPPPLPPRATISPPIPPVVAGPGVGTPRTVSSEQVDALRMASRQLDEIANQLEQRGLYQRADQMRQLAQELRVDARSGVQERSLLPTPINLPAEPRTGPARAVSPDDLRPLPTVPPRT